jgi:hypothetical protein
MTRVEFVIIAIRLMSLAMFAKALLTLAPVAGRILADFGHGRLLTILFFSKLPLMGSVIWAIGGLYCRRKAETLAWQMFADDDDATAAFEVGLTAEDVLSLGCAVIGIVTIVPTLRAIVGEVVWFAVNKDQPHQYWYDLSWRSESIALLLELAIGVWLLLGSRGFARVLAWARQIDGSRSSNSESNAVAGPGGGASDVSTAGEEINP